MRKPRRTFTEEFKHQMVNLYQNGKKRSDLIREYDLTASALNKWIAQAENTGSFTESGNRTQQEKELIELRKRMKGLWGMIFIKHF